MKQVFLFLFLAAALLTTACSYQCSSKQKARTHEIRFALNADPQSLDPRVSGIDSTQVLTRTLFDGLMHMGRNGKPEPSLASSYTLSEDETTYTFTLRPSKWSNGQEVTASDFVYAWKSVITQSIPSAYVYAYFIIKNARAIYHGKLPVETIGLEALDTSTLRITLEHPAPYFLELLCNPLFSPLCQSVAEANPKWTKENFVSNGPFVLHQYKFRSTIILKKNPLYWARDTVKTETLSFSIVEDPVTAYNMFITGSLDWYGNPFVRIPLDFLPELNKKKLLTEIEAPSLVWLICNTRKKHLSIFEARLALALAIDRPTLCKDLLHDSSRPSYSFVPPTLSLLPSPFFKEDQVEARKLLNQARQRLGYKDGKYPPFYIMSLAGSYSTLIQAVQYQLQKTLHTEIHLDLCDESTFWPRILSGNFDLAFAGWISWFDDPGYTLDYLRETDNGINGSGWSSAKYKQLLEASDVELDKNKRTALLREAEALAMREMPIIPICSSSKLYAKSDISGEIYLSTAVLDLREIERNPQKTASQ